MAESQILSTGFIMDPPPSEGPEDTRRWGIFLFTILNHFECHDLVEVRGNCIYFNLDTGRHSYIPFKGPQFREFGIDVPNDVHGRSHDEEYAQVVITIARNIFGDRIGAWKMTVREDEVFKRCHTLRTSDDVESGNPEQEPEDSEQEPEVSEREPEALERVFEALGRELEALMQEPEASEL
ncbi:hypothetical protein GGR52DRAFT_528614 [Hypoxylon sp. FL1284]|nr:hypothetical protein GGR52DRAFT_528614 [Hypoxylon sp. FL1284]